MPKSRADSLRIIALCGVILLAVLALVFGEPVHPVG